eukprot:Pgem_evm1s20053
MLYNDVNDINDHDENDNDFDFTTSLRPCKDIYEFGLLIISDEDDSSSILSVDYDPESSYVSP